MATFIVWRTRLIFYGCWNSLLLDKNNLAAVSQCIYSNRFALNFLTKNIEAKVEEHQQGPQSARVLVHRGARDPVPWRDCSPVQDTWDRKMSTQKCSNVPQETPFVEREILVTIGWSKRKAKLDWGIGLKELFSDCPICFQKATPFNGSPNIWSPQHQQLWRNKAQENGKTITLEWALFVLVKLVSLCCLHGLGIVAPQAKPSYLVSCHIYQFFLSVLTRNIRSPQQFCLRSSPKNMKTCNFWMIPMLSSQIRCLSRFLGSQVRVVHLSGPNFGWSHTYKPQRFWQQNHFEKMARRHESLCPLAHKSM